MQQAALRISENFLWSANRKKKTTLVEQRADYERMLKRASITTGDKSKKLF